MDIKIFSYDTEAYENGLAVSNIPGFGDIELTLRGQLSDIAMATRSRLTRAVGDDGRENDGQLTPEAFAEMSTRVILEACLIGWNNIESNGKSLEFNSENAAMLLSNKRFRMGALAYALGKVEQLVSAGSKDAEKN